MKFIPLLSSLILESSRFEVLYDKYVKSDAGQKKGLMDFNKLLTLILADPTTNVPQNMNVDEIRPENMDNVKIGKYTQWIIKNFVSPSLEGGHPLMILDPESGQYRSVKREYERLFFEDLYKVTTDLMKFEKFKSQIPQEFRDINKLTLDTLYDQVKNFSLEKTKATKEEKEKASTTYEHPGGKIVHKGKDWTVVEISDKGSLGKDAACFYGGYHLEPIKGETRWCSSSPGLTHFNTYINQGPLYVVLPNKGMKFMTDSEFGEKSLLPALRYQFHFESNQFKDPDNKDIDLIKFLNNNPELKELFKPKFVLEFISSKSSLSTGNTVKISYPNGSGSKFIALYGFEELFDVIPETITDLTLENTSSEIIGIDVPKSIGKFKLLDSLTIKKFIRSLPEEIGDLNELTLITLIENPELKKLPESLGNLKNLEVISLNGTPAELPKSLKDKTTEAKKRLYFILE